MNDDLKKDLKNVKSSFQKKTDKLINALEGSEYQELVNLINESWTDENAKIYLDKLQESIEICKKILRNNNAYVQGLVDSKIK